MKHILSARQVFTFFSLACFAHFAACTVKAGPVSDALKQDVVIPAGDIELGATLYRPAGYSGQLSGQLPAIVTGHGSAPSTRKGVEFYTHHALRLGFAVLSFDKRGTGQSGGKYESFSVAGSDDYFRLLASDMQHAVHWVMRQPDIDTDKIGFFGGSQAGWIMTLAASNEPRVAFVIVGEGVPVSAGLEALHGSISGDVTWNDERMLEADMAILKAPENMLTGYDPAPALIKMTTPTLWIFGLRDPVIPVTASIKALESLIKTGKTNNKLMILPFGDHNFLNVATGERYDIATLVKPWLAEHRMLP